MHYTTNKDGQITSMHIEDWDTRSLGEQRVKQIQAFSGSHRDKFLHFLLKEKLFLKIQILYEIGEHKNIWFWTPSAGGEAALKSFFGTFSLSSSKNTYAVIYLNNDKKMTPFIQDDRMIHGLAELNFAREVLTLKFPPKQIKDISVAFNAAKSKTHGMRFIVEDSGLAMWMKFKGVLFVCTKADDISYEILSSSELTRMSNSALKKYARITWTNAESDKDKKELAKVTKKIGTFFHQKTIMPSTTAASSPCGTIRKLWQKVAGLWRRFAWK